MPLTLTGLLSSTGLDRAICDALINLAASYDFTKVVSSCTRESAILDLVFLSDGLLYSESDVDEGISDHKAVIVHLDVALEPNKPTYSTVHDFSRPDDNSIVAVLASHFDEFVFE